MDELRKQKLIRRVQEMFRLRNRSAEGDELNASGVPKRISNLGEEIFTQETQFYVPGRGPQAFSGTVTDYYAYHAKRVSRTQDKLDLELLDILAGDNHVAALVRYRDEPGGHPFEWLRVNVFTFNEAGDKITEIYVYEHDQYGVDTCFSKTYSDELH